MIQQSPIQGGNRSVLLIAWRSLVHDRARFAVTTIGIVFAVVLITMEVGLYLGFSHTITQVVQGQRADLWVMARDTKNFEIATPIRERDLYRVLSLPGVDRVERLVVRFTVWKKPQGDSESVMIVGFDPNGSLSGPWDVVQGETADLRRLDSVMVDRLFMDKLGITALGDSAEIAGHRARVVGFTDGIRSFTTSPMVFSTIKNALNYAGFAEDGTTYGLVRVQPGTDPAALAAHITATMPELEALTQQDFADRTLTYWMFTTGAGSSVILGALLALVVGIVIVAQVLYATTMDHLWEFGTLRAMGAPSSFIVRIILAQAGIAACFGYGIGGAIGAVLTLGSRSSPALILVPLPVGGALFLVTLLMCVLASLVSIRKVLRLDPVMVFQR